MATKMKIRKGDTVTVLSGRDKGKNGEVVKVLPKENRAVVSGINQVKRHQRPNPTTGQGGIFLKELPIHVSNIALIDPKENKPTRVGYTIDKDGNKKRVARRSGELLD